MQRKAKSQASATVEAWLEERCEHWNQGIAHILGLHLGTPAPRPPASYQTRPFGVAKPTRPGPIKLRLLDRIFRSRRERVEAQNRRLREKHAQEMEAWEAEHASHDASEAERRDRFLAGQGGHHEAAAELLEGVLSALDWPRETLVSFEFQGPEVWLDVDLPEIEDLPGQEARVAKRGLRILVKDKSGVQSRRDYLTHIHAIGFRLAGEVFHLLPWVEVVAASGYSQRPDPATGHDRDDYLFSARIRRTSWEAINFDRLDTLDLAHCFGAFELRRSMTKTGIFKPIEPFQPATSSGSPDGSRTF